MVTSAGLIETLDTGSGNYKESKITKGETFSYLDCITGDALVSLISGEETNFWDSLSHKKMKSYPTSLHCYLPNTLPPLGP